MKKKKKDNSEYVKSMKTTGIWKMLLIDAPRKDRLLRISPFRLFCADSNPDFSIVCSSVFASLAAIANDYSFENESMLGEGGNMRRNSRAGDYSEAAVRATLLIEFQKVIK
jgi:hypothetical protein